jgi:hypothetical protein
MEERDRLLLLIADRLETISETLDDPDDAPEIGQLAGLMSALLVPHLTTSS